MRVQTVDRLVNLIVKLIESGNTLFKRLLGAAILFAVLGVGWGFGSAIGGRTGAMVGVLLMLLPFADMVFRQEGSKTRATDVRPLSSQVKKAMEEDMAIKHAWDVLGKYGDVLIRRGDRGQQDPAEAMLWPISELPASKEEIKNAMKLLLPTIPKEHAEQFKGGYVRLANFAPDADATFVAERWRHMGAHPQASDADAVRFRRLLEQKDAEQMLLLAEIGAFAREQGRG